MEFEQIYNTYFKAVYRYIWQLSGNFRILLTRMILLMSRLILRKKQRNYGKSYIVYLNHIRKFSCGVSLGNYHLMK